jgi:hypothetical protein
MNTLFKSLIKYLINDPIGQRLFWIAVLLLCCIFSNHTTNKDVCIYLKDTFAGYYETELDSLAHLVTKNVVHHADSFEIDLNYKFKTISLYDYKNEHIGFPDTTNLRIGKKETEYEKMMKEAYPKTIKENALKFKNDYYEKMFLFKRILLKIYPDLYSIKFNQPQKTVLFRCDASDISWNQSEESIKVIFIAKKINSPLTDFKGENYPTWDLDEWAYEIKPQWYILYNISKDDFMKKLK